MVSLIMWDATAVSHTDTKTKDNESQVAMYLRRGEVVINACLTYISC